jgi:ATP-dependent protease HslVU (ClpYQ) peptidase subunit
VPAAPPTPLVACQDKLLRELDASLIVADANSTFWLMGNGDVLEAEADGVIGIGSGADFAESAARALLQLQRDLQQQQQQQQQGVVVASVQQGGVATEAGPAAVAGESGAAAAAAAAGSSGVPPELLPVLEMSLFDVAQAAMTIAANSCIYTNSNFSWQHIKPDGSIESGDASGITNVAAAGAAAAAAGSTA